MAHLDEITIRHEQSGRQLRMARLYGFRNIQVIFEFDYCKIDFVNATQKR